MKTFSHTLAICGALLCPLLMNASVQAHHSTAQFDMTKRVTYVGTVKKFDYQNPHAWIWLEIPQSDGTSKEVGIECGSPSMLRRNGLSWDALKKGEKVTIEAAPFRDAHAEGGILNTITWADGHKWGGKGPFAPQPDAGGSTPAS